MNDGMSGKLWTFGDSHTAGHELGTGLSVSDINCWVRSISKFDSHHEAQRVLSNDDYISNIMIPWHHYTNQKYSPELSYAGLLASENNLQLVNCAVLNASMDQIFRIFNSTVDKINFDEDEVLLAPTFYGRWTTQEDMQFNVHFLNESNILSYMQLAPCDSTQVLYYYSMIFYMQTTYPKIKIVKIYDDQPDYEIYKSIKFVNDVSMFSYFRDTIHIETQYPAFHFNEAAHEYFATYVNEKWYD
jgi:hypothetical protein